jgi:hypothetical protein
MMMMVSDSAADSAYNPIELLALSKKIISQNQHMTQLLNKGQIESIDLPRGWQREEVAQGDIGSRSLVEFKVPDAPDARLAFFYRGLPINDDDAATFHATLEKPPHHLTPTEIKSLAAVLRERANPEVFKTLAAYTESMNGKNVLVLQGRYAQTGEDLYEVLVDASGDGKAVQEMYFQAPRQQYERHLAEAKRSFQTVKWKQSINDLLQGFSSQS